MTSLSYLIGNLERGNFDCIEFGDRAMPGRLEGALRIRLADSHGSFQVSKTAPDGQEVVFCEQCNAQTIDSAVGKFTARLQTANPRRMLGFFGVRLRGSRR